MSNQSILNYYGHKPEVKLDTSELYDYEIGKSDIDFDISLIDFSSPKEYSSLILDSSCFTSDINDIKPLSIPINREYISHNCHFIVSRRPNIGWTLNFVFNNNSNTWEDNNIFYYWGIENEENSDNYVDNNLSFSFNNERRVLWKSIRFSGYCDQSSGFTPTKYLSLGQTQPLCSGGTSNDFNITITFKRNFEYNNCEIENEGGWNDMVTGYTVLNPIDVMGGSEEIYTITEQLTQKWFKEQHKRIGTLKIYLNGRIVYTNRNWEEVIPSQRSSLSSMTQIFGGGTTGCEGVHEGYSNLTLKLFQYFESPLNFMEVNHNFLSKIKPSYNINKC
jgi:hypothetical protein